MLYVHQGKQTSSSFNDPAEAYRFKDEVDRLGPAEALRIWKAAKPSEGHTVASFIAQQIEELSVFEKKTLGEYERYLHRDIAPVLGHIPLSTLARSDISRWVNAMRDAGASGKTVQNKMGFLSGCLNAAVREGLIAANPAAGVRLPRTVQREMRLPDAERIRLAADLVHPGWWSLLDFLVASGCRLSEATALMSGDVDRAKNTVRVSRALEAVARKRGAQVRTRAA